MWTIFNGQGQAVANCDGKPALEDLALRGERAVFHQEDIPLAEAILDGDVIKRKPLVELALSQNGLSAAITVSCSDAETVEITLLIGGVKVVKPPGDFAVTGEPGIRLLIDIERDRFRGDSLEVIFDG